MAEISVTHFGDAVTAVFQPLADRAGFELRKLRSDIYEIAGENFILRIRQGTGHFKDVLVTLAPSTEASLDLDYLTGEIGLNNIAEYHRLTVPEQDICSVEGFYSSLGRLAKVTETVCMPYLLGQKSDYGKIRAFVDSKIEDARKQWGPFPSNVREEWL